MTWFSFRKYLTILGVDLKTSDMYSIGSRDEQLERFYLTKLVNSRLSYRMELGPNLPPIRLLRLSVKEGRLCKRLSQYLIVEYLYPLFWWVK